MKRYFDIFCSLLGIIILSPLFIVLSIIIIKDTKGGIFFRGERVGKNGVTFRIFKFRSMIKDCEGKGNWNVGDNDIRITKIGHFLRNTKLDELPQLINVLVGNMSLVGPRPELKYYTDMYSGEEKKILHMKPGITDWASIANFDQFEMFTKAEDPDEVYINSIRPLKLKLQMLYYENQSFITDLRILSWTIFKVLLRSKALPKDVLEAIGDHSLIWEEAAS